MAPTSRRAAAKAEAEAGAAAGIPVDPPAVDAAAAAAADNDAPASGPGSPGTAADLQPKQPQLHTTLPVAAQFPLVATLSFAMASLGYSLLGEWSKGELAAVSRSQETWNEVGILAGWRLIELGLAWFGSLDGLDAAMMDLMSHGPTVYLLATFYGLSPTTAFSALVVDITSVAVPFYLVRPLSTVHKPSGRVPNRELIDIPLQLYTTALSTAIYAVILVLSLRLVLPRVLVLHFSGLPSLEPAYSASYATVVPVTALFGAASSLFIFAPFATTGRAKEDDKIDEFNPSSASLVETVWWNTWGYTAKSKVIIQRTALAVFVTGINTYLACTMTIHGIESAGAIGYASVWVLAALSTGVGLGLVGKE